MEQLALFTKGKNGELIPSDITCGREERIPDGLHALAVAVFVADSHGHLLMTLRAPEKKDWPNYWENSGGAGRCGEMPIQAIVRELYEETGITSEEEEFIPLSTVWFPQAVLVVYMIRKDWKLEDLVLQEGETVDARWCTVEEYESVIEEGLMCGPVMVRYEQCKESILHYLKLWNNDR